MEMLQYVPEVFEPTHALVLIVGVVGGLLLGAAPGLSPTMAVALLIPFTFYMDAIDALILLSAVYAATVAGGAVSAILIKVPGAPANIATTFDGYPMAEQGRAVEALHYAFISTAIGGVLGMVVLIFLAPPVADMALRFGPAELFWVAILGITVIGTVGSRSVARGLFAGAVGMWIGTIGHNPILAQPRFVFTQHLAGGIEIVVALIGLFAIPQVFALLETAVRGRQPTIYEMKPHSLWQSFRNTLRQRAALVIGSITGIVIGIIPGAGGQIAGLIAYDQARKLSRDPSRYGKGEPAGVVAAESANNAMVGPSLVPLLTLGIPGSPTAAVLLGGLLIHGLFPGPDLFSVHARITWTFIAALLVGQILIMIFGLGIARYSRFVMQVPNHYMAAAVTILAVFGTYSIQNNFSDVMIMFVLGTGMYLAMKVGFEPAPVVLGIILGPIAEGAFLQGQMISGPTVGTLAYFTSGAIVWTLIVLCVLSLAYSIFLEVRQARRRRRDAEITQAAS